MLRRKIGTSLLVCGIVMLMFGVSALPALGATPSTVLLAPSPRPPLQRHRNSSSSDALQTGHITGTIIDTRTGAPAVGVPVNVGGVIVWSDANGNYDRWLPVGTYTVVLALASGQGTPAQDAMTVTVKADAATVQHLSFHGEQMVLAAPVMEPTAGIASALDTPTAATNAAIMPTRLPVTGNEDSGAWMWLGFGMLLLLVGGMVGFGPVMSGRSAAMVLRAHASNSALLRALLTTPLRSKSANEELLAKLLGRGED